MRTHVAAITVAVGMLASAASAQETKVVPAGPQVRRGRRAAILVRGRLP